MNSVALPASATSPVLSAEADLVRQAARGDADAFGELYRRHSAPAWRLAQAVTIDKDSAVSAFRDGFVKAVRAGRFSRRATTAFRPQVLASVYRAAIDLAYDRSAAPAPRRAAAAGPDAALADAAFRSLPERWRAALWLGEVENFDSERIAAVLGVSAAVAEQLMSRGKRGLAGRFAQAHHEAPEHIGETLRPLAIAIPANLADVTASRWSASGADALPTLTPVTGWLEDRAVRPMSVAVGALIGLGLIGLGVVPGGSELRSQLGAAGINNVSGAVPVHTCLGLLCPSGAGPLSALGLAGSGILTSFPSSALGPAGSGSGAGFGSGGGSGSFGTGGSGSSGPSLLGGGGGTLPSSGGGGGITLPGGVTTPTLPGGGGGGSSCTGTTVCVSGTGSLTVSGSSVNTNLLNGTANLTGGTGGVSGSIAGQPIGTSSTTSSTTSTTTTTVPLVSGTTNTITNTLSTTSSTLTSGL